MASQLSLGVVILAAGRSTRMGQPKLLLPWGDTTVLGHLLSVWRDLKAEQIAVVRAEGDRALDAELERLGFSPDQRISNPAPERGMFSSIQCAAQWSGWKAELSHWAMVLGDQPHLRRQLLRNLLEFSAARPDQVCQPARNGHRRHPVFLPGPFFRALAQSSATDLKAFLATHEVAEWESDDPGLDLDIDRPEDYEKALRLAP